MDEDAAPRLRMSLRRSCSLNLPAGGRQPPCCPRSRARHGSGWRAPCTPPPPSPCLRAPRLSGDRSRALCPGQQAKGACSRWGSAGKDKRDPLPRLLSTSTRQRGSQGRQGKEGAQEKRWGKSGDRRRHLKSLLTSQTRLSRQQLPRKPFKGTRTRRPVPSRRRERPPRGVGGPRIPSEKEGKEGGLTVPNPP